NSCLTWMRSPVATGIRTCAATLASAFRFSGGTGSSIQEGPVGFELAGDGDRGRRGEAPVHLDEKLVVRADRVPDGLDQRDRPPLLVRRQLRHPRSEGIELERPIPLRDHAARRVVEL